MSVYTATDTELTSVADAIRTKGGTEDALEFPDGFVEAIQNIPSGGLPNMEVFDYTPTSTLPAGSTLIGNSQNVVEHYSDDNLKMMLVALGELRVEEIRFITQGNKRLSDYSKVTGGSNTTSTGWGVEYALRNTQGSTQYTMFKITSTGDIYLVVNTNSSVIGGRTYKIFIMW